MDETQRKARNTQRLQECYPAFGNRVSELIGELEDRGFRPRIQEAWRSPEQQLEYFRKGTSKVKFGYHNVTGPGGTKEALACDVLDDDNPLSPSTRYLLALAIASQGQGLSTGIRWGLGTSQAAKVDAAVRAGQLEAAVAVGWDPAHVEVSGISIRDAASGIRPDGVRRHGGGTAAAAPSFPGRPLTQPPIVSGDDVRVWQRRMFERGWRNGWTGGTWGAGQKAAFRVDGDYGPISESICRKFQAEKRLRVDGIVDRSTWKAAWSLPVT